MINFKLKKITPIVFSLVFVGSAVAGCSNDAGKPQGVEAQKNAVIGATPPPDVKKQIDAMRAEDARKQAEGQAAGQAAAKAAGK